MRVSPKERKKTWSKRWCKTWECGMFLDLSDDHNLCVLCLDNSHFRPSHKLQMCLHRVVFNPSSYQDHQKREGEKAMGEEGSQWMGYGVAWGGAYCIPKKHQPPPSPPPPRPMCLHLETLGKGDP